LWSILLTIFCHDFLDLHFFRHIPSSMSEAERLQKRTCWPLHLWGWRRTKLLEGEFVMTRFDFTPYRRSTVGFDRLFELLETTGRAAQNENYPPFNIERTGENDYKITVAVAGFKMDEIDIVAQQNLLIVTGSKQSESNDNRDFLHMGIATRNFERRFQLADHIHVIDADMADGLLIITLVREVPEALKPRKIAIGAKTTPTVIEHDDAPKKKGPRAA
jgi:molecular chaperone IbpA